MFSLNLPAFEAKIITRDGKRSIFDVIRRRYVALTPEEWVAMFKNARFVFTGTFHGVIFSILNHRQFKVYLTNKGRIAKVGNLLSYFSIKDREIDNHYIFDLEKQRSEIDYASIDRIIDKQRLESLNYLRDSIQSTK